LSILNIEELQIKNKSSHRPAAGANFCITYYAD